MSFLTRKRLPTVSVSNPGTPQSERLHRRSHSGSLVDMQGIARISSYPEKLDPKVPKVKSLNLTKIKTTQSMTKAKKSNSSNNINGKKKNYCLIEQSLLKLDLSIVRQVLLDLSEKEMPDLFWESILELWLDNNAFEELICYLFTQEIQSHEKKSAGTLFRTESLAVKLLGFYFSKEGFLYLKSLLSPLVKKIQHSSALSSLDFDPFKIQLSSQPSSGTSSPVTSEPSTPTSEEEKLSSVEPDQETVHTTKRVKKKTSFKAIVENESEGNQEAYLELLDAAQHFIDRVFDQFATCPILFRKISAHIYRQLQEQHPELDALSIMGCFFFLRIICPSIVNQTKYIKEGSWNNLFQHFTTNPRVLVVVSKVVQCMANNTVFEGSGDAIHRLNLFIQSNQSKLGEFVRNLLDVINFE